MGKNYDYPLYAPYTKVDEFHKNKQNLDEIAPVVAGAAKVAAVGAKVIGKVAARGAVAATKAAGKGVRAVGKSAKKAVKNTAKEVGTTMAQAELARQVKKQQETENIQERGDFWHPDPDKDRKLGGPGANQRAREDRASSSKPKKDYSKSLKPGESYMDYAKRKKREKLKEEGAPTMNTGTANVLLVSVQVQMRMDLQQVWTHPLAVLLSNRKVRAAKLRRENLSAVRQMMVSIRYARENPIPDISHSKLN